MKELIRLFSKDVKQGCNWMSEYGLQKEASMVLTYNLKEILESDLSCDQRFTRSVSEELISLVHRIDCILRSNAIDLEQSSTL